MEIFFPNFFWRGFCSRISKIVLILKFVNANTLVARCCARKNWQTCLMIKIFFPMFSELGIAQGSQKYFCFWNLSMLKPLLRIVVQGKTAQFHFRQEQTCLMMKIFFRMFSEKDFVQGSQKYFYFWNFSMLKPLLRSDAQSKTSLFHYKPTKMHKRNFFFWMFSEKGFVQGSQK